MLVTKPIDLPLLQRQLDAASVTVNGLGLVGVSTEPFSQDVHTYTTAGAPTELPPAAVPVVNAHVAPPLVIDYAGRRDVDSIVRTTDDHPREVFRFPTEPKHVYRATLRMTAIDATSGTTWDAEVRLVFKRTATLQQVGSTVVLSSCQDAQAASWAVVPSVDGTDLVISVRGAAGRTIDWLLVGEVGTYAPDGL